MFDQNRSSFRSKPRSFGSSPSRGGFSRPGGFGRPSGGGRYSGNRSYGPRRPASKLGRDVSIFIKEARAVSPDAEYVPSQTFDELPIATPLKENIARHGYINPTPIQDQAILPILEGRDLIGLANTGTGKTAAFLIPLIDKIFKNRNQKALIVVPTRELAQQIQDEFRILSAGMKLYSTIVIGGANIHRQIHEIHRGQHVIIGTPGRLKDLIQQRVLFLDDFANIVLDEVDLMVDIGFIADVQYFISLLPKVRQSLFFSATISKKVELVLKPFVTDPVTVSVKQQDTAENIDQNIVKIISREKKLDQLHDLLISDGFDKVLIFGRTKHGVEDLHKNLVNRGFKAGAIHGNKKQGHRQRTLESFKRNEIQILLATDVAARGLDIDNVSHVINYDLPETYEDYIHRIGRTGRANRKGIALTFVD